MDRPHTSVETAALEAVQTERGERRPIPRLMPDMPDDAGPTAQALGFSDTAPGLLTPGRVPEANLVMTPPAHPAPVRLVFGSPPVVPSQRPGLDAATPRATDLTDPANARVIQLARGLDPEAARNLPSPTLRPEIVAVVSDPETAPATQAAEQASAATLISPRPEQRPVTISSRAPTPQQAELVLAAATPEATAPAPRLSDPVAPRRTASSCNSRRIHAMPRRGGGTDGASTVTAAIGNGSGSDRDNRLVQEALRGNMPDYLRELQPVTFAGIVGGRQTEVTICVTPDYLAIGSNADHVRVPLGLPAALRVADAFDMMLPTTRMVDAIYAQADLRLNPQPMTPGAQMSSTDYFVRHDQTVDQQFSGAGGRSGILVAGHKKDLVIANRLSNAPGRVAIYGWHRSNGNPIQPLSTVHGEYYADYSHGIRMVSRTAFVNGQQVDLRSLLTDGAYASLLNNDGPLSGNTIRLASLQ